MVEVIRAVASLDYQHRLQEIHTKLEQFRAPFHFTESQIQQAKTELASALHENWRRTSGYTERWKPMRNPNEIIIDSFGKQADEAEIDRLEESLKLKIADLMFGTRELQKRKAQRIGSKSASHTLIDLTFRLIPKTDEGEIDIQNRAFKDLAPWMKKDNEAAAAAAVEIVVAELNKTPGALDLTFLERCAAEVHRRWLDRNPQVRTTPQNRQREVQATNYDDPDFPEEEKNRDREHVILALEEIAKIATSANTALPT